MRDGFAFLQTMIDREYLDVERSWRPCRAVTRQAAFFAEGKCAFISSLCRAAAFARDYPFAAEMTALPVLKEGPVCVVGADQRLAVNPNTEHLGEALAILENLCTTDTLNAFAGSWGRYPQHAEMRPPALPSIGGSLYPVWHPEARFPIRISRSRLIPGIPSRNSA